MTHQEFCEMLYAKYGRMFYQTPYIECPDGWHEIIEGLTEELYSASLQFKEDGIKVSQIKEKFGGLRYYVDYDLPDEQIVEVEQIIRKWEKFSYKICADCGSEENVVQSKKYWESTLCTDCLEKVKNGH